MNKRKQRHIENLLKSSQPEKASEDFTTNVMSDLIALSNEEILQDAKLASLLKKGQLESPSSDFVTAVMSKVEAKTSFEYEPIISKRVWILISAVVTSVFSYVLYSAVPASSASLLSKTTPYLERTQSVFEGISMASQNFLAQFQVSSLLAMSLIALMVLIFIDFLSKEREVI